MANATVAGWLRCAVRPLERAMIYRVAIVSLLCVILTATGFAQARQSTLPAVIKTNRFVIHLQEGFYENRQAVIAVDGNEVYRATPKTSWGVGLAAMVPVTNVSSQPVVVFSVPSMSVTWSNRIDLGSGGALGFSLRTNGQIRVLQSTNFFYD